MGINFEKFEVTSVPNYRKIKGGASSLSSDVSSSVQTEVIIRVKAENYVPSGLELRNRLSPYLFTATTRLDKLQTLDNDSKVASVSLSQKLRTID